MLATVNHPSTPDSGAGSLVFDDVGVVSADGRCRLEGVSLVVPPGAVTVVAGPSGSGKSTLMRLGNGLERPTSGSVRFRGRDAESIDPRELRRRVGMVFQKPLPFPGSVRDNLRVAGPDSEERSMIEVLDRVGLHSSFLDRAADDLSGGECQRMCVARTLMTAPEVLLMDEPTSALDPDNRSAIERLAETLTTEGLAILWVSHDLAQVRRIADEILVLTEGRPATPEQSIAYLRDESGEGT